ncbi:MAG: choice-of-anchor tandem repeat NxxGxxAF-containing protein [Phycisphaerales bacterium]
MKFRIATMIGVVGLASGLAHAGPIFLDQIMRTSDAVPGVAGATWFTSSSGFQAPTIDNNGMVSFRGRMNNDGTVVTATSNDEGYFFGGPGSVSLMVREGVSATPDNANSGGPGATYTSFQTQTLSTSPNGNLWLGGTGIGGTITSSGTSSDNRFIWTGPAGSFALTARMRQTAPGTAGAVFSSAPDSTSGSMNRMNNAGQTLVNSSFTANVGDTGAVGTNDAGMYVMSPTGATLIMRRGNDAGLGGGEQHNSIGTAFLNGSGQVMQIGGLKVTGSVTTSNDGVMNFWNGSSLTTFAREGGASGVGDLTYPVSTSTLFPIFNTGRQSLNNNGVGIFFPAGSLAGTGVSTTNDTAVFAYDSSTSTTSIFKREGDTAPGVSGAVLNSFTINDFNINNNNKVAWAGTLVQDALAGITAANDSGLWLSDVAGASDSLIVQEGMAVPGITDAFFGTPQNVVMNNQNQILFVSTMTGAGVTTASDRSLWAWDPVEGLMLVCREGDSYFGLTASNFNQNLSANGEGGNNALSDAGWASFTINGATGTNQGIVVRTMIPAPGALALLGLGGLLTARRRR